MTWKQFWALSIVTNLFVQGAFWHTYFQYHPNIFDFIGGYDLADVIIKIMLPAIAGFAVVSLALFTLLYIVVYLIWRIRHIESPKKLLFIVISYLGASGIIVAGVYSTDNNSLLSHLGGVLTIILVTLTLVVIPQIIAETQKTGFQFIKR